MRRTVSPIATSVSAAGVTRTVAAACDTVTVALPAAEPDVAVTLALPTPAAVTRPVPSTVATDASLEAQVTVAPGMTRPFWSSTCAVSCVVSPSAVSAAVAGDTVTDVATGGGGGGGGGGAVGPSSPQETDTTARKTTEAPALRRPVSLFRRRRCVCMPSPLDSIPGPRHHGTRNPCHSVTSQDDTPNGGGTRELTYLAYRSSLIPALCRPTDSQGRRSRQEERRRHQ